ncbi:ATP-dependent DNA helicase DinG [Candidatus Magnetomoraceae bacterium gMMP-1]
MLNSYSKDIKKFAFLYAHSGLKKDNNNNRIYSIALTIIDIDKPKQEFESFIRYELLTGRERYYSNVSKEMLESAPTYDEAAKGFRKILETQDFVFALDNHNIIDDLSDLCKETEIIDLSFASEFFLPYLSSYTPGNLWEYIFKKKRSKASFTAMEIVNLSIELVKYICGFILNDNNNPQAAAIRYYLKRTDILFGRAFIHITKNYKKYFEGLFDSYKSDDTIDWMQFLEKSEIPSRKKNTENNGKKISPEHLETLYKSMSESEKEYKFRPEQVEYARHIASTLNDTAILTIEAGTGTGKTQGYLIPALEFLYKNKNARLVISTYTKNLQEQIFQRELTFTKNIFKIYKDIPVALLKGKSSHICVEKLNNFYNHGMEGKRLLTWLYFVNLVFNFRNADMDSIGEKIKYYLGSDFYWLQIISEISAKTGCTPKHSKCPALIMTAEARAARLIITNHHKLALLDHDRLLENLFRNYIIDEANHFEHAVRSAFKEEANSREITITVNYLKSIAKIIKKKSASNYEKNIKRSISAMNSLKREIKEFRFSLLAINPKIKPGVVMELQYSHPAFENEIKIHIRALQLSLQKITNNLSFIKDKESRSALKIQFRTADRMKVAINELNTYSESLNIILKNITLDNNITAYQIFNQNWKLIAQSVDVTELIRNNIHEQKDSIIYTAATLCNKGSFNSFRDIIGMEGQSFITENNAESKEFRFEKIPSPFSKDAMKIFVPDEAVSGKFNNKEVWLKTTSELIPELIKQNKGRTLVLFSSYSDLNLIAEEILKSINSTQYPLLIQQQGIPTINLCDEFRSIKESVLFGVDTFWYGVDFKGDTLTQVIITRIPYPSPSEPIQMARKKMMSPKEFWKRYNYDTDIKMKQGIGRLIRCDTDSGNVVILDSRYRNNVRITSENSIQPAQTVQDYEQYSSYEEYSSTGNHNQAVHETASNIQEVIIYTCGICTANKLGGYAAELLHKQHRKEIYGGCLTTTSNRMSIIAAIEGLKALNTRCMVTLYNSNNYLIDSMLKGRVRSWKKNGWKNKVKKCPANLDLWKKLLKLCSKHDVSFVKLVKNSKEFKVCNKLAKQAAAQKDLFQDKH